MHSCLLIDEIIIQLAVQLFMWGKKCSLKHMALACRTFYEPVMNELWKELTAEGFLLFARCLPLDVVEGDKARWTIARVPLPDEWSRFDHYTIRVRTLTVDLKSEKRDPFADYDFLNVMSGHFVASPAFPNLHHLRLLHRNEVRLEQLSLFLTPHLQSLSIPKFLHIEPDDKAFVSGAIALVKRLAKDITDLKFEKRFTTAGPELMEFSELPCLRRMSLNITATTPLLFDCLSDSAFASLTALEIKVLHFAGRSDSSFPLVQILRAVRHVRLQELVVGHNSATTPDSALALFTAVSWFSSTLVTCDITFRHPESRYISGPVPIIPLLHPLRTLTTSLHTLALPNLALSISLAHIETIMDMFPNLTRLELGQANKSTTPSVPLGSLPSIVKRLLRLQFLGLVFVCDQPLDDDQPVTETQSPLSQVPSWVRYETLDTIDLGNTYFEEELEVIRRIGIFIARTLPKVDVIPMRFWEEEEEAPIELLPRRISPLRYTVIKAQERLGYPYVPRKYVSLLRE